MFDLSMFEKYLICDDSLRNIEHDGRVVGFSFEARLGYYRGLGLSMVEKLDVVVDGVPVPRDLVRFRDGDRDLTMMELEQAYDRRWEFGAKATITVMQPGGIKPGRHRLDLTEVLRISYMPLNRVGTDSKQMTVAP
jgi:hypothetical protein